MLRADELLITVPTPPMPLLTLLARILLFKLTSESVPPLLTLSEPAPSEPVSSKDPTWRTPLLTVVAPV